MFVEKIREISNICIVCLSSLLIAFLFFFGYFSLYFHSLLPTSLPKTPSHPLWIFNIWSYNSTYSFGICVLLGGRQCCFVCLGCCILLCYYSALKEILPFATPWMDLEDRMLNEISQTQKEKYCMISDFIQNLKKRNT